MKMTLLYRDCRNTKGIWILKVQKVLLIVILLSKKVETNFPPKYKTLAGNMDSANLKVYALSVRDEVPQCKAFLSPATIRMYIGLSLEWESDQAACSRRNSWHGSTEKVNSIGRPFATAESDR